jgi:hypothetical protein
MIKERVGERRLAQNGRCGTLSKSCVFTLPEMGAAGLVAAGERQPEPGLSFRAGRSG